MKSDIARKTVFSALYKVIFEKGYSNIVFSEYGKQLSATDKKFAAVLFYGVLERKITLDSILDKTYDRKPDKITYLVLLMGAYQIKYMNSVPDFAAVNSSVELVKSLKKAKSSGFVNAVLHKIINNDYIIKDWEKASVLPEIYSTVKTSLGDNCEEFFSNSFGGAPVFIRVNTNKVTPEELKTIFKEESISCEDTDLPYALAVKGDNIFQKKSFNDGLFFVQDLSCQKAIASLNIQYGDTVFDMCAAPGGKSFSAALNTKGTVYSFDIFKHKIKLISDTARKLGLENIKAELKDGSAVGGRENAADKIICDVPCSGIGVIRRKPEIRFSPKNTDELIKLQHDILHTAGKCVKKGGVILYSTCTVNKDENEKQVETFLNENSNFRVLTNTEKYGTINDKFGNTFLPQKNSGDGFFFCLLERIN